VHAKIVIHPRKRQTARLVDLNSLNACFVNDNRVQNTSQVLHSGDIIRFGYDNDIYRFYFPEDVPIGLLGESAASPVGEASKTNVFSLSEGTRRKREDLGGHGVSDMFSGFKDLDDAAGKHAPRRGSAISPGRTTAAAGLPSRRPASRSPTSRRASTAEMRAHQLHDSNGSLKPPTTVEVMPSLRHRAASAPAASHRHYHTKPKEDSPPWKERNAPRYNVRDVPVTVVYPRSDGGEDNGAGADFVGVVSPGDQVSPLHTSQGISASITPECASPHPEPYNDALDTTAQSQPTAVQKVHHTPTEMLQRPLVTTDSDSTRFGGSSGHNFPPSGKLQQGRLTGIQEFADSLDVSNLSVKDPHVAKAGHPENLVAVADFESRPPAPDRYPANSSQGVSAKSSHVSTPGDHTPYVNITAMGPVTVTGPDDRYSSGRQTPKLIAEDKLGETVMKLLKDTRSENALIKQQLDQLTAMVQQTVLKATGQSLKSTVQSQSSLTSKRANACTILVDVLRRLRLRRLRSALHTWSNSNFDDDKASVSTEKARCMSPPRPSGERTRGFAISTCSSRAKGIPDPALPGTAGDLGLSGTRNTMLGSTKQTKRGSMDFSRSEQIRPTWLSDLPAPDPQDQPLRPLSREMASQTSLTSGLDYGVRTPERKYAEEQDIPAQSLSSARFPASNAALLLQDTATEIGPRLSRWQTSRSPPRISPRATMKPSEPAVVAGSGWSRPLFAEIQHKNRAFQSMQPVAAPVRPPVVGHGFRDGDVGNFGTRSGISLSSWR
jgi:hypothetical protein